MIEKEHCQTLSFEQPVTLPGCQTTYIANKACYGQCNSGISNAFNGSQSIMTCRTCYPTKMVNKTVSLQCDGNKVQNVIVGIVLFCQCRRKKCPNTVNEVTEAPKKAPTLRPPANEWFRHQMRKLRKRCRAINHHGARAICLELLKTQRKKCRKLKIRRDQRKCLDEVKQYLKKHKKERDIESGNVRRNPLDEVDNVRSRTFLGTVKERLFQ